MNKLSFILVDDHRLFREALAVLLHHLNYAKEVYEASGYADLLTLLKEVQPDIIFMDIALPDKDGIEITREILLSYPDLNVIGLSMFGDEHYVSRMIEAGAKGFILKNSGVDEVEAAVKNVLEGRNYFSPEIMSMLVASIQTRSRQQPPDELSDRETEILLQICQGLSNQEIADALNLSKRTIDKHRENILSKSGAKNTAALVVWAVRKGILKI